MFGWNSLTEYVTFVFHKFLL